MNVNGSDLDVGGHCCEVFFVDLVLILQGISKFETMLIDWCAYLAYLCILLLTFSDGTFLYFFMSFLRFRAQKYKNSSQKVWVFHIGIHHETATSSFLPGSPSFSPCTRVS